jgi:hypothetical protein
MEGPPRAPCMARAAAFIHLGQTRLMSRLLYFLTIALALGQSGCRSDSSSSARRMPAESRAEPVITEVAGNARLRVFSTEAKTALVVMTTTDPKARAEAWGRLKATEEYRRLGEREESFHRSISDTAFYQWLTADSTIARAPALKRTLNTWMASDIAGAVKRSAAYLPRGTPIRAALYFMIKPHPNTFVYDTEHNPTIFVSVDSSVDAAQFENEIAHELHHIGISAACPAVTTKGPQTPMDTVVHWMSAFGEGWAMLAAAGGPDVNPHWESDSADRARWDRDYAHVGDGMKQLSSFFDAVLTRKVSNPDSVQAHAMSFFGIQGPWYTVGYLMARTVAVTDGREKLVSVICSPPKLLLSYQEAAKSANRSGANLPLWPENFVDQLRRYVQDSAVATPRTDHGGVSR